MKSNLTELMLELKQLTDTTQAKLAERFFKTGKGQYGEGDRFRGIKVPVQRTLARKYAELSLTELQKLLASPFHEDRLTALLIMAHQTKKARQKKLGDLPKLRSSKTRSKVTEHKAKNQNSEFTIDQGFQFYMDGLKNGLVNNWDLVDGIAEHLVGAFFADVTGAPTRSGLSQLKQMARSQNLWERRTAIVATFAYLRKGHTAATVALAHQLCYDSHDLMHKAVGWLMREVGKRDGAALRNFLKEHAATLPRTLLRYAIEKISSEERQKWMRHP